MLVLIRPSVIHNAVKRFEGAFGRKSLERLKLKKALFICPKDWEIALHHSIFALVVVFEGILVCAGSWESIAKIVP